MRALVTCSCGHVPATAEARYRLKYRDEPPAGYIGKDAIRALRDETKGPAKDILNALATGRGRFAYYMEWDDNSIITQYDLLKNKEIV